MCLHARVAQSADLRTQNRVVAWDGWREMDMHGHAGDGVLLEAHAGNEESVDDVDGAQVQVDFPARWQDQNAGDDIVGAVWIGAVNAERVSCGRIDQLRACEAEGRICAGIAEIPLELLPGDFDLKGLRRGSLIADGCPEALGADGHPRIQERESEEQNELRLPEFVCNFST